MRKRPHRDYEGERKAKRSNSPVASREDLEKKKIELIIYVGNLPLSWNDDDIK